MGCGAGSKVAAAPQPTVPLSFARPFAEVSREFKALAPEAQEAVLAGLRRLTPEQRAADEAEREQAEKNGQWIAYGGGSIDALLEHTPLLDLEYTIDLIDGGGVLPRKQDVPLEALHTPRSVWRLRAWRDGLHASLPVLVLSYPWLDWWHPDRDGAQLRRLLPIFRALLAHAKNCHAYGAMGLLIDYACLPQKPFASDAERACFSASLGAINEWYFHPTAYVLLVTTPPPEGLAYTNTTPHSGRGWCFFELTASALVKGGSSLLDFSKHPGDGNKCALESQMKAGRVPPRSPVAFAEAMKGRVEAGDLKFTANADMEFVIEQYRVGFIKAVSEFGASYLFLQDLGWGDEEGAALLEALEYAAEHCRRTKQVKICAKRGNSYSSDMLAQFAAFSAKHESAALIKFADDYCGVLTRRPVF